MQVFDELANLKCMRLLIYNDQSPQFGVMKLPVIDLGFLHLYDHPAR